MTMRQRKRARFTRRVQIRNVIFCDHGTPPGGYVLAGAEYTLVLRLTPPARAAADLDTFSRQLDACLTSVKGLTA